MAKTFKIQRIAAGLNEWGVWVLDSNGRLWSPRLSMATGAPMAEWNNDSEVGAIDLAVDGHGSVWVVNAEGKIYSRQAPVGIGDIEHKWIEANLKDDAGKFVKTTQISAGENTVVAVDDKKRIWQRHHAGAGATGSSWILDKSAANVKCVAAGNAHGDEDVYCINESGTFYKLQGGVWNVMEAFEGDAQPPRKLNNLSNAVSLEMGRHRQEQFFYTNLFYLGKDGHIYQPGGIAAVAAAFYKDTVGVGVDFAVRQLDDIWMVNAQGAIYRRTKQTFSNPLAAGASSSVKVQGDEYFWTPIKGPDFNKASIYWIQKGNTFNQLALDLGTTAVALKAKNQHITNTDTIKAGDLLHLA